MCLDDAQFGYVPESLCIGWRTVIRLHDTEAYQYVRNDLCKTSQLEDGRYFEC